MSGFRKRLLIFLSALPALVLLIVLTGGWRILLTPAVIAFLKDVIRTLWCGLLFGVGMSVFLLVALTMFDHAKDSRESRKCVPYLTVSLLLPVVGLWAAFKLADQPSTGNGVGLLLGIALGVLLFEQVWPRLSPAWVSNYLTLEERYGLRLETNTPLSPFLEHLMLDMHPIFPNVAHRTVLTNTGAWNPQTIRKNTKRITDENMLQKVMGKNA